MVPARLDMLGRLRIPLLPGLLALALASGGCGPSVADLNANPAKYYEEKVTVRARVSRRQVFSGETLLELADVRERRILARVKGDEPPDVDDWIKAKGVLVGEMRVGGQLVYDVIAVESWREATRPRIAGWF